MLRTERHPDLPVDPAVVLPRRVLIAEDDRTIAADMADLLSCAGFQAVGVAQDGPQAIEMATRLRPDVVVIMNIKMPGGNGFDATRIIIGRGIGPVIMLSAAVGPDLVGQAVSAGAMAYLVTPVYPSSLLATMEMALARYAEQHQLRDRAAELKQHLDDAKLVDRAKGLLMVHHRLSDAAAAQWLQQTADGHGRPVNRIAQDVIADLTGRRRKIRAVSPGGPVKGA